MNFLNILFVYFALVIIIQAWFINLFELYLPIFVVQLFRYGKMAHKGEKNPLVTLLEVPKSWFRHIYLFAVFWSILWTCIVVQTYILNVQPPARILLTFLNLITGSEERPIEVNSTECFVTMLIFTIQVVRRCYESHFVQIFSSAGKINIVHFLWGICHYFAVIIGIVANAEGFVTGTHSPGIHLLQLSAFQVFAILLFLYSWHEQFKCNIILVNLRKDNNGKLVNEKHLIPNGGWFELVSSPHMLFEVVMYITYLIIMPNSLTMRYTLVWVIANQTESAWLNHKWYKDTFGSKYPIKRKAILPWIL